jgi:hypothetical protein
VKPRTTLIIVALFALLAGYVYFFELNKTPEQISAALGTPTAKPPQYVVQVNTSGIQSVEINDLRAPREVKLTRVESGWQVNQPAEKAAERFRVDAALSALANLRASRVLTNVTDLAPFGLITPTLEARIVMSDTQQYAITVGNKSPDNRAYYVVYTGDKAQVFMVDVASIETLKEWLDAPPYEPTPTPTFTPTATPAATVTPAATETPTP